MNRKFIFSVTCIVILSLAKYPMATTIARFFTIPFSLSYKQYKHRKKNHIRNSIEHTPGSGMTTNNIIGYCKYSKQQHIFKPEKQ